MKRKYILLYHTVYWLHRVLHSFTYTYVLYKESWYKGAYVVQLVLMPFFYINYGLLIPALIKRKYVTFFR